VKDDIIYNYRYYGAQQRQEKVMPALPITTVPITVMGDANEINAHLYCAHSKIKRHTFSLNSHTRLFGMDIDGSI
jgi:hypothetical protein